MKNLRVKSGIFIIGFFIVSSLFYVADVSASGIIQLPQTGQTTSTYAGDAGNIRAGVAWPEQRFIVSDDCVTDNLTGLMWPKSGNLAGSMPWNNAIDYANKLTLCGYSDWRLPNINELASLLNAEFAVFDTNEWINSQGMVNVQSDYYWSSTTVVGVGSTNYAWYVDMAVGWLNGSLKDTSYYVLPVRSGQSGNTNSLYPANLWKTGQKTSYRTGDDGNLKMGVTWPNPRFTLGTGTEEGCVIDNLTGLMWIKNVQLATYMSWYEAIDYANNLTRCGHSDWRLSNRKELLSLVDYSQFLPNGTPFTNAQMLFYWSSNNAPAWGNGSFWNKAWLVGMWRGDGGECDKESGYNALPVRGGNVIESYDYYCDSDDDKYFSSSVTDTCFGDSCIPLGCQSTPGNDCNDDDELLNPGAVEICDKKDNNCDGYEDYDVNVHKGFDIDNDGYTTCGGDCNDNNWAISPRAKEICGDGLDNNCNGSIDENVDNDNDGYTTCDGDCNDNNPLTHPGMTEICDGDDNDCDGSTDESLTRQTTCGVGECASTGTEHCYFGQWSSSIWDENHCTPGAPSKEICSDGKDNDCDGFADSGDGDCFTHYKLKVNISGKGNVVSKLPGISCKDICTQEYDANTLITLKATPLKGYKFSKWSGACKGSKTTCTVKMNKAQTATAVFKKK